MNDSILFLALATIFGVAMLIVGWAGRGYYQDRVMDGSADQMDRPFLDG